MLLQFNSTFETSQIYWAQFIFCVWWKFSKKSNHLILYSAVISCESQLVFTISRGGSSKMLVRRYACPSSKFWLSLPVFIPLVTHQYMNFEQKTLDFVVQWIGPIFCSPSLSIHVNINSKNWEHKVLWPFYPQKSGGAVFGLVIQFI